MTETPELLPCPFCGDHAAEVIPHEYDKSCVRVRCDNCWAESHGAFHRDSDGAIKEWNTRAPSTVGVEDEIDRDDPQFNRGVNHVVDLLAKTIDPTDWVAGDGSEDYDEDLAQTLLNILEARGLYDCDEGRFASLLSPTIATALEIQTCPECCGTGFANHYLTDRSERECWKCKGTGEIAVDTNLLPAPASLIAKEEGTVTEFRNELGNVIRITIEGPTSKSTNDLTPLETAELNKALTKHFTPPLPDGEAVALADELFAWVEQYARKVCPEGCLPTPGQEREIAMFAKIVRSLRASPPPASAGVREALELLLATGMLMLRATPKPGSVGTVHTYQIEAAYVWALEEACKAAERILASGEKK